jgi:predicted HicB family RNase H-like nuclease
MQAGVKPGEFQVVGKKLDEDKVVSALSETFGQENVESFYAREFDLDKVLEFCKDKGIAPPVVETLSVSLRASKKGLDKAAVNAAKQSATKIVEQGSSQVDLGDDDELDQSQTPSAA